MDDEQGTIEESGNGVTSMTYSRRVNFHRVTKEEVENLMSTSLEFQICTGLSSLALGAFLSGCFSERTTLTENVIFYASIPFTIIFFLAAIHFYRKMRAEKENYFKE